MCTENRLSDRARGVVPQAFMSSPSGCSAEYYECEDGLIKIAAGDIRKMKSDGYKGVLIQYKAYAAEYRDDPTCGNAIC